MRGRRYSCRIDLYLTFLSFVVTFFRGVDPHPHRISHSEPTVPAGAAGRSWVDSVVSACDFVRCFGSCLTFLSFLPFPWLYPESHPHLNSSPRLHPMHPILPPSSDACGILFRFPAPTDASRRSWGRHAYNCFVHTGRCSCCSVCINYFVLSHLATFCPALCLVDHHGGCSCSFIAASGVRGEATLGRCLTIFWFCSVLS